MNLICDAQAICSDVAILSLMSKNCECMYRQSDLLQVREAMMPYLLQDGYFMLRSSFSKPGVFTVSIMYVLLHLHIFPFLCGVDVSGWSPPRNPALQCLHLIIPSLSSHGSCYPSASVLLSSYSSAHPSLSLFYPRTLLFITCPYDLAISPTFPSRMPSWHPPDSDSGMVQDDESTIKVHNNANACFFRIPLDYNVCLIRDPSFMFAVLHTFES